ncbi:NFACT family protein [Candidatus Poribacteria bacterium]|nr:NFACT family protein [Candidatus Poribacteria bacterium]
MSFDSLILRNITHEYQETLLGGTIRHIQQVNPTDFTFKIAKGTQNYWIIVSAHSNHARTHLIQKTPKGQKQSYLADYLSTHLKHGTIIDISQVGLDRILKITIQPVSDDPIQPGKKTLILEFMGKHSNIILIDNTDDRILECLKHIDETMSRFREVLPGETYTLPPQQDKLDPFSFEESTYIKNFQESEVSWKSLFNNIDGLSPTLAKEIVKRSENTTLWDAYQQVIKYFHIENTVPQVIMEREKPIVVSPLPLFQFTHTESLPFNTMSEALTTYYDRVSENEKRIADKNKLLQAIKKQESLLKRKEKGLTQDLARAENADAYRIQGELILANINKITRGQKSTELQNYYSPDLETLKITLNPELTPSDNAQTYFKKYTKAKRGYSEIQQRLADLEAEYEVLKSNQSKVDSAETLEDLEQILTEFIQIGYIKTQKHGKQQETGEGPFRRYTSSNGFQIYVGRNSQSNDLLLRQIAKPRDMWLHAKQIHGSHVIIRNPENRPDIPMPTLLQAAQLAAFYSKAHHSSYVPVDYTWSRYVVKRKGNVAGFVHYTQEKTLYVEPAVPSKVKD